MFRQHILTRGDEETIKKVYMKQKEHHKNGDWIKILYKNPKWIVQKKEYRQIIKKKIREVPLSQKKYQFLVYKEYSALSPFW